MAREQFHSPECLYLHWDKKQNFHDVYGRLANHRSMNTEFQSKCEQEKANLICLVRK